MRAIFGNNELVGRKFFDDNPYAEGGKLLVTSVFRTLQGEGPFAGRPAIFVRLAKCNLSCSFCDTYFDTGDWMTYSQLTERIIDAAKDMRLLDSVLVITGGEPMLQKNLNLFLVTSSAYFDKVQIESNGLQLLNDLPRSVYLVVSPKCVGSGYSKPPDRVLERAGCLKFVVSADPKSPYHTVPRWAHEWKRDNGKPVYISPMNVYKEHQRTITGTMAERNAAERVSFWEPGLLHLDRVRANHEYAAVYALEHGLYLTLQMQLFASIP